MGYIAATLMTYTTMSDAFLVLLSMFTRYELDSMFKNGFPGLQESYYIHDQLMKKFLPDLHRALHQEGIVAELYATHWFMT